MCSREDGGEGLVRRWGRGSSGRSPMVVCCWWLCDLGVFLVALGAFSTMFATAPLHKWIVIEDAPLADEGADHRSYNLDPQSNPNQILHHDTRIHLPDARDISHVISLGHSRVHDINWNFDHHDPIQNQVAI